MTPTATGYPDAGDAYWNDAKPAGSLFGSSDKFNATFDGGGHTIANLYIDSDRGQYVGLFAYTAAGSDIRGVGLVSVQRDGRWQCRRPGRTKHAGAHFRQLRHR